MSQPQTQSLMSFNTWVPTYTNLTVGNGTVVARYAQQGALIYFSYTLTLGSTSAVGTGPTITLPKPAQGVSPDGLASYIHTGAEYFGLWSLSTGSTIQFCRLVEAQTAISATVPFTWATGDVLFAHGIYEGIVR